MKKKTIAAVLTGLIVVLSLLLPGCNNVMDPYSAQSGGRGTVTVSFSAGRAALSPANMEFDVYNFIFRKGTQTVLDVNKNKGDNFVFSLETGSAYTLEVKAYKGSVAEGNLSAQGTAEFTVSSSGPTSVPVKLSGILTGGGKGTFAYSIHYPEDATIEELVLEIDAANSKDLTIGKDTTGGSISGTVDVEAGWYFLVAQLSKEGKTAGYANGVVIYPGQTTLYEATFEEWDFKAQPDEHGNIGKRVYEWHGFDVEGHGIQLPSMAVGTLYETFTDNGGNTWDDVLKLEAPEHGYPADTMAMTYPITEPGDYYFSMDVWVEGNARPVAIRWAESTFPMEVDDEVFDAPLNTWFRINVYYTHPEWKQDCEVGIWVNSDYWNYRLRDATLYFKDLVIEFNGEPIVDNGNVRISTESFTLVQGNTRSLKANVDVDWSSDNPGVATVDSNGLVSAVGVGTTTIRAVSKNDPTKSAASVVKVVAKGTRYIALTFDDGPNPQMTPQFLEVLDYYGAHATFMCVGQNVAGNTALLQTMDEAGHEIGNHTYNHEYSGSNAISIRSVESLYGEILQNQNAIHNAIGKMPVVFRAPALLYSRGPDDLYAEKQYGENVEEACRRLGLALIDTTDHQRGNFDWDGRSAEAILATVKTLAKDWGIILLHDWPVNTLEALPDILEWLQGEGYSVLTVSELAAKRKAALDMPPASDLEPGRIYYNLIDMPAHVSSITVDPVTLEVGQSATLSAVITPAAAQRVYWYSDNPYIASINQDSGVVTAVSPGAATIRAAAGGMRAFVTVTVNGEVIVPDPFDAITEWIDEDGFNIKGAAGMSDSGPYYTSNADWDVGSYKGYDNVLRLSPDPETGKYYWVPSSGGGVALTYDAPFSGKYSLSMEVWVDTDRNDAGIIWYNCDYWWELSGNQGVSVKRDWFTRSGVVSLNEGDVLGLLAHSWYGDSTGWEGGGLKHSTVYIRDLKLVYLGPYGDGPEIDIMDIPSTAAPPPPDEELGITFEWANGAVPLTVNVSGGSSIVGQESVTVTKGSVVTLTAVGSYVEYEWWLGRQLVKTGQASYTFTATEDDYTILLWVDGRSKGASIQISVN